MRKTLHLVAKILFNLSAILLGVYFLVSTLLVDNQVETLLTDFVFKDKPADSIVSTGKEPVRYKSWYSSVEDNLNGNGEVAWAAQSEGTVLLQNDNDVLPLADESKVSLFGVTAYDPMYCLDGAGNIKINDPQSYSLHSEINRRQFYYNEFENAGKRFGNKGLNMNKSLYDFYNTGEGKDYRRFDTIGYWGSDHGNGNLPGVIDAPWSKLTSDVRNYGVYGKDDTTAIYITGRMTNENVDLPSTNWQPTTSSDNGQGVRTDKGTNEAASNDYLALTQTELDIIDNLKTQYKKLVVIFNQANAPQSDIPEVLKSTADCKVAALWVGFPGSDGIKAVADIVVGAVNPSGGLSAGWYTSQYNNPSMKNFSLSGNVVNMEGLYVGYRYAETRYEDALNGGATYNYDKSVSYPFGHGLSYTNFSYGAPTVIADPDPEKNYYSGGLMAYNNGLYMKANGGSIEQGYTGNHGKKRPADQLRATGSNLGDNDDLIIKVPVTNRGAVAGKEIVQIYLQQPITDTDRAHNVQKPAVQLVGYGKTKVLKPNESETVEIKIDANKWFASYDDELNGGAMYTGGGYVLAKGEYLLVAARNAHEAVNSIYKYKNNDVLPASGFDTVYGAGNKANVAKVEVSEERSNSYKYWTQGAGYSYSEDGTNSTTVTGVFNLFSDLDPNKDGDSSNDAKYFNRYDWANTAQQANDTTAIGESGSSSRNTDNGTGSFNGRAALTSANIDLYEEYYKIQFNDATYNYGGSTTNWQLANMIGIEFDPSKGASDADIQKWAEIVGQLELNVKNNQNLFASGRRQTVGVTSIGKPTTTDQNASNGFEWLYGKDGDGNDRGVGFINKFDPTAKKVYPTGYPCEGIIAATFNNDLARLVGNAIGEDALWSGIAGLYGFGLGLQRNPYHGRAGEFYSDDPFLTGMIGGYETLGAQEKGVYVYNKHFVLNDQERSRTSYRAWLDEQTFRQVYLRPFELAIEIGDAMNVMIAFNLNGNSWGGGNYNIMTRWLRGEAGMSGFAVTDWYPGGSYDNLGYGLLGGCDLADGSFDASFSVELGDARYDNCVAQSATRILYTVANSNAMNFIGDDTKIYTYPARWTYYRDVLIQRCGPAFIVTFALTYAFVLGTTIWTLIEEHKKRTAASGEPNGEPSGDTFDDNNGVS